MAMLQTLERTSTEELLDVFNLSFSDYVVPLCLTQEQLEDKIKSDGIRLEFSAGAFENNRLIAFVLHGYGLVNNLKVVYNAGTGVIPTKRGNKLTAKLYEYALPLLHENNTDKVLLEVIDKNGAAISTYTNIGFKVTRQLNCFKGSINATNAGSGFEVRELKAYDWPQLRSFWDVEPSWQNSIAAVEKLRETNVSVAPTKTKTYWVTWFTTRKQKGYSNFRLTEATGEEASDGGFWNTFQLITGRTSPSSMLTMPRKKRLSSWLTLG